MKDRELLHQCEDVLAAAQDQLAKLVPDWLMYSEDPSTNEDLEEYEQVMESIEALLKTLSSECSKHD